MSRPTNAIAYEPIDLKLGIKSSLPRVKSTLALLFLLWESESQPAELVYARENGNGLILEPTMEEHLLSMLNSLDVNVADQQFHSLLEKVLPGIH